MIIEVDASQHDRIWCPVTAEITGANEDGIVSLVDMTTGITLPAQTWSSGKGRRILSFIVPALCAGCIARYKTYPVAETDVGDGDSEGAGKNDEAGSYGESGSSDSAGARGFLGVRLDSTGDGLLDVYAGPELFTTYNYGTEVVKPYLYPLYAHGQVGITRNWPMVEGIPNETYDHPHHKGLYTAQGEVNGVDIWAEGKHHGRQIHTGFTKTFDGPVDGGFTEELDWIDEGGNRLMAEARKIKFYAATPGIRLIDYTTTLQAKYGRVILGDTKEAGLLSVRVATSMDADAGTGGQITNGFGGKGEAETWGKPAPWCDYSGRVNDGEYGICMMDHPSNPRHPTPWHVRGYGLMTANCFGYHDFTGDPENRRDLVIEAGDSATWRYRVLIHRADAAAARVGDRYLDFAYPPKVKVLTTG